MTRPRHRIPFRSKQKNKHIHIVRSQLDKFTVNDIHQLIAHKDGYLRYHWDYYNELAYQRSKISDKIKDSIIAAAQKDYIIEKWQRALKYKYRNEPFSVAGSLIDPGDRFNIGNIDVSNFTPFPSLHIARDKSTAMQELLCQKEPAQNSKLNSCDLALASPDSISIVSLTGSIGSIINLKNPETLQPFIDLIKDFTISDSLKKTAKTIGEQEPILVKDIPTLINCLLAPNWRLCPMQFDVPASSQIFGKIVFEAGIGGILYPSKFTSNDCLAVFPDNFDADSYIKLDDADSGITNLCLNAKTWKEIKKL